MGNFILPFERPNLAVRNGVCKALRGLFFFIIEKNQ